MILVTGATGNVGSEVALRLLGRGRRVRALVRGQAGPQPPGVEVARGDLDDPGSLAGALEGVRGVFLLGGHRDMAGILAELRRARVDHVVLLTSRSVVGGDSTNAVVRMWLESEAAVRSSGVPWTILQPSGFMSNALRWLPQLRAGDVVRAPFASAPIAVIDPRDVAAVAAEVMTSERHHARAHVLSGPEALVPAEQVRLLAAALGRDLRFEEQPEAEARDELGKAFPPSFVEAFFRFFADGEFDDARVVPTVQEITGRPAHTFGQWAREHASRFH